MVSAVKNIYLPVHIATEYNYLSMGLIFLLKELLEEEYQSGVIIYKVSEP
ncbi:TPA: LuxR family transcriptional regulator, partial [Klebsiella pneumoniae]|nr:LuxR family transcriptional regulator [Klebsiella pneumoniae]